MSHRPLEAPLVRWAELDVEPAKLPQFKSAALALREAVLRLEPGVAAYHAACEADDSGRVHVLEIYDDATALASRRHQLRFLELYADDAAYRQHLESPHFTAYAQASRSMIRSKRLIAADPIFLTLRPS